MVREGASPVERPDLAGRLRAITGIIVTGRTVITLGYESEHFETPDPGVILLDIDVLIDLPWFTVAKFSYDNGYRWDMVWCENTDAEDIEFFFKDILPLFAVFMFSAKSHTLPCVSSEHVAAFWVSL